MSNQGEDWEKRFNDALEAVRRGDFQEVKDGLASLDFVLEQTKNPDHWMYYHPLLREDPLFRYPRNLFRPHGSRRRGDRISRHDQSQARQAIEALRVVVAAMQQKGGGNDRDE